MYIDILHESGLPPNMLFIYIPIAIKMFECSNISPFKLFQVIIIDVLAISEHRTNSLQSIIVFYFCRVPFGICAVFVLTYIKLNFSKCCWVGTLNDMIHKIDIIFIRCVSTRSNCGFMFNRMETFVVCKSDRVTTPEVIGVSLIFCPIGFKVVIDITKYDKGFLVRDM